MIKCLEKAIEEVENKSNTRYQKCLEYFEKFSWKNSANLLADAITQLLT
jgi:hypothetical protein